MPATNNRIDVDDEVYRHLTEIKHEYDAQTLNEALRYELEIDSPGSGTIMF